jgi:hypothetical protein
VDDQPAGHRHRCQPLRITAGILERRRVAERGRVEERGIALVTDPDLPEIGQTQATALAAVILRTASFRKSLRRR